MHTRSEMSPHGIIFRLNEHTGVYQGGHVDYVVRTYDENDKLLSCAIGGIKPIKDADANGFPLKQVLDDLHISVMRAFEELQAENRALARALKEATLILKQHGYEVK